MSSHRKEDAAIIRASGLFDEKWYLEKYPDVKALGMDPVEHYLSLGALLGRAPSPRFDPSDYLKRNADVAKSGINPLLHHIDAIRGKEAAEQSHPIASKQGPHEKRGPQPNDIWSERIDWLSAYRNANAQASENVSADLIARARILVAASAPTVSVIMPAWNRAHVVCNALNSVLRQSYKAQEIIVVDDGSSDGTADRIKQVFAAEIRSGFIKLLRNDHKGVSAARNAGLRTATGQLFAYLDSDNQWTQHYLLVMSALFSQRSELATAYAALQWQDEDTGKTGVRASSFDRRKLLHQNFVDLNIFMHRRELYDQLGEFDESLSRLVDWDLICRYTKNYTPAFLPYIGVNYFLSAGTLGNITKSVRLDTNRDRVLQRNIVERLSEGLAPPRIAYFVPDDSGYIQTAALSEIGWLVEKGFDVKIYYGSHSSGERKLHLHVESYFAADSQTLAGFFNEHKHNICHTHLAQLSAAHLVGSACMQSGVRFTVTLYANSMSEAGYASDIDKLAASEECLRIFVAGNDAGNLAHAASQGKIALRPLNSAGTSAADANIQQLLDTWFGYSVDIIVTASGETAELLQQVLDHTDANSTLNVVLPEGNDDIWKKIKAVAAGRSSIRLLRKSVDEAYGSACNIAIDMSRSEFVIHINGNVNPIKHRGWEGLYIDYMRANPTIAMAGRKVQIPQIIAHPCFGDFRNKDFAVANHTEALSLITGEISIIRRDALAAIGGFNSLIPQELIDLELSYCFASRGYQLGHIPAGDL